MTEAQIAWIAGIVEGEGTVTLRTGGTRSVMNFPTMRVSMTDEDVIRTLHKISGVGNVHHVPDRGPNRKPVWIWTVAARDETKQILSQILPWMHGRRSARIREALVLLERPFKRSPAGMVACGTTSGFSTHYRKKEEACEPCKEARRTYNRDWERQYRAKIKPRSSEERVEDV